MTKKSDTLRQHGWYRAMHGWWHDSLGEITRCKQAYTQTKALEKLGEQLFEDKIG